MFLKYYANKKEETEKNVLEKINRLPDEIILMVKEYLRTKHILFLNKQKYYENHTLVKQIIIKKSKYEDYVRNMIMVDCPFVFEQILKENIAKWLFFREYIYKNNIYANYLYFLLDFCVQSKSNGCKLVLTQWLEELGLRKNQHKKKIIKNII